MFNYYMKINVNQYKDDEFINSLQSLLPNIQKEIGCEGYHFCKDLNEEHVYILTGEWKSLKAMDKHFHGSNFEFLIGASRVLGQEFKLKIGKYFKTGGLSLLDRNLRYGNQLKNIPLLRGIYEKKE